MRTVTSRKAPGATEGPGWRGEEWGLCRCRTRRSGPCSEHLPYLKGTPEVLLIKFGDLGPVLLYLFFKRSQEPGYLC